MEEGGIKIIMSIEWFYEKPSGFVYSVGLVPNHLFMGISSQSIS